MFRRLDFSITPYRGDNPPVTKPDPAFLAQLGEEGMRQLLRVFYTKLFASPIAHLFPADKAAMMEASQHSADFFIQICGGPKYFNQRRGAPQMRTRHAPFAITPEARMHWLSLFEEAIDEVILGPSIVDEKQVASFWHYLDIFSLWMVNTR